MIMFLVGFAFIILMFRTRNYPKINSGVSSRNYTLEKISSGGGVYYDNEAEYFIIYSDSSVLKVNHLGDVVFSSETISSDEMYLSSHYALSSNGVIDLSVKDIRLEELSKTIYYEWTRDELKLQEEKEVFDKLYFEADTVVYFEISDKGVNHFLAYFKVKGNWSLLHSRNLSIYTTYSDELDCVIHYMNYRLEKMNYLKYIQSVTYEGIDRIWYRDFKKFYRSGKPLAYPFWSCMISYKLKIGRDRLRFQAPGVIGFSSLGIDWIRLPEKELFSNVSFIRVSSYSKKDSDDYEGLYIIKNKTMDN